METWLLVMHARPRQVHSQVHLAWTNIASSHRSCPIFFIFFQAFDLILWSNVIKALILEIWFKRNIRVLHDNPLNGQIVLAQLVS